MSEREETEREQAWVASAEDRAEFAEYFSSKRPEIEKQFSDIRSAIKFRIPFVPWSETSKAAAESLLENMICEEQLKVFAALLFDCKYRGGRGLSDRELTMICDHRWPDAPGSVRARRCGLRNMGIVRPVDTTAKSGKTVNPTTNRYTDLWTINFEGWMGFLLEGDMTNSRVKGCDRRKLAEAAQLFREWRATYALRDVGRRTIESDRKDDVVKEAIKYLDESLASTVTPALTEDEIRSGQIAMEKAMGGE